MSKQHIHLSKDEIILYIKGQCTPNQQEAFELELQLCEHCAYLFAETSQNILTDEWLEQEKIQNAQQIFRDIQLAEQQANSGNRYRNWHQRPIWQIAIAACITCILLYSGAIAQISEKIEDIESKAINMEQSASREENDKEEAELLEKWRTFIGELEKFLNKEVKS